MEIEEPKYTDDVSHEDMVQDTLEQLQTIRNNEYIDDDGVDSATD